MNDKHTPRGSAGRGPTLVVCWALLGHLAVVGCAHIDANYPANQGSSKWASNFDGVECEYEGIVFKVKERSHTIEIRQSMNSLDEAMESGMDKRSFDAMKEQELEEHRFLLSQLNDKNHVFYLGSLTFAERKEIVVNRGCLLLTIRTERGIETTRDAGILFPRHVDKNDFQDSGIDPVSFGLDYNGLLPGDENRIFIRSRVVGTVQSVAVDSSLIRIGDP